MAAKNKVYKTKKELMIALAVPGIAALTMGEQHKPEKLKERFAPFINPNNIGLLLTPEAMEGLKKRIYAGVAKLDKHYVISLEPGPEKDGNLYIQLCQRQYDDQGNFKGFVEQKGMYLSEITAEMLMNLITKFFTTDGTTDTSAGQQ